MPGVHRRHPLSGRRAIRELSTIAERRGLPCMVVSDNGPEFISEALDRWAYENGMTLDFSQPGKPTDNRFVESFNAAYKTSA
jgi:putative transposase